MQTSSKSPAWTAERTALALDWWRAGWSARAIAEYLGGGVSRCAVLSKMHRQKAPTGRSAPAPPRLAEAPSGERPRRDINRSVVRRVAGPRTAWAAADAAMSGHPPREPINPLAFAPLAGSRPRPWETRQKGECAWPVDVEAAPDLIHSCCRAADPMGGYCAEHEAMAREPDAPTADSLRRETDQLVAWLIRKGA